MKTVLVEVKKIYGIEKIYPANETAHLFASIAGTKTLTRRALTDIKKLGYLIEQKTKVVEL